MIKYPVMEHFYTLQGEGFHSGKAAYFIRLGGCDVGCVWCDVKDSWDSGKHPLISIEELLENIRKTPVEIVVITGGEPLMHDLNALTSALKNAGYKTNIETSGSSPLSGIWDWICLSPKKFKKPLPELLQEADELKIIIFNKSDFQWAEEYAAQVRPDCVLLLQPEWSQSDKMLPLMVEYVKQNPKWRMSLQTHKFMQIP